MSYHKLTPIVAKGATEPRYLEDRFADVINVKDFGAKGDGITNDTAAFASAAATGKTIYVPAGTYNLTYAVHGDFVGVKDVHFTGYKLFVKKLGGHQNTSYMKRPVVGIRLIWNELASYSETRFIPQALAVFEDYVFLRMTPNESNPTDSRGWIGVFDIVTGEKVTIFSTGPVNPSSPLDQGLRVYRDAADGKRKLVSPCYVDEQTSDGLAVYDITTLPSDGAEISPTETHPNLNLYLDWFYGGGFYYVCQKTRQDSVALDRTVFAKYNEDFERVGFVVFPQTDGARISNPYTYEPTSDADDIKDAATKAQGWAIKDGVVYMSGGASAVYTEYGSCNGIRGYNASGEKMMSALCFPDKYMSKLASITGDTTIDCENEGLAVDEYGIMYSLEVTIASNQDMLPTDRNFWVIEEMSDAVDAVDFSDTAAMDLAVNVDKISIGVYPATSTDGGKMMNPWTGGVFTSIDEVLDYMVFSGQKTMTIYVNTFTIKDLDDTSFPDVAIIKLLLLNGSTVFCQLYRGDDAYGRINNTEFLYRKEENAWGKLAVQKRSLPSLIINKNPYDSNSDPGGTIYSVSKDRSALISCLDFSAVSAGNLLYLGGQSASNSPDRVYLGVKNSGGTFSSTMFIDNTFRPGQTGIDLGTGSFPWENVYATSGPWSSSDERKKDNIEDISESVMRAWGKVRFKVFQFKNAIKNKGNSARLHVGVIAQEVAEAFASEGLDAGKYGLFGYDEWTEERNESGEVVVEAGSSYSIRYEEALALECAYQRWRLEQLEERVNQLINNNNNNN